MKEFSKHIGLVLFVFTASVARSGAQNSTETGIATGNDISKPFISIAILVGAVCIALATAKAVDYCYDRAAIRDDASDISEHTRKLIKARLALSKFKKPKKKQESEAKENTRSIFRFWSSKAKTKSNGSVINVEEAETTGQLRVNGNMKLSAHVTFEDDNPKGNTGDDSGESVYTIVVPDLKKTSSSGSQSVVTPPETPKSTGKDSSRSATSVKTNSGKTTPVKSNSRTVTSGKESPGRSTTSGHSTPTRTSDSAHNKKSAAKSNNKKDVRVSSTGTIKNGEKSSSNGNRPKTAPSTSKPATVKAAASKKSAPLPKPAAKASPRATSGKTNGASSAAKASPRTTGNQSTGGKGDSKEWTDVNISVKTATSVDVNVDDDGREDSHRKVVHFSDNSEDLLIPVSTDEKPKAEKRSFEKDVASSSSGDYEFLNTDQSAGKKTSAKS